MTEDVLENLLIERLDLTRQTRLAEVRRALRGEVPHELLDGLLLALEQQGRVLLTPHARPELLTLSERQQCISTARGLLYLLHLPLARPGD